MQRNLIRVTTAGAALGLAALMAPAVANAAPGQVIPGGCAKVASTINSGGWGNDFSDEQGQAGTITPKKVVDDDGSLEFKTTESMPRQASYRSAADVPLTEVVNKPMTFQKTEGQANWQIRVRKANNPKDDGFATLVWSAPLEATTANPANSDQWWSTRQLGDLPARQRTTLDALVEAANSGGHTTVVEHYGISSQPPGKVGTVNVDHVSFNGCTTNFAATGAAGAFGSLENLIP